jgi:nicotinamidase-related amidase
MNKTALLVVDVQNGLIGNHPFNEKGMIENIQKLLKAARKHDIEVIYVRHDGGIGSILEKNTAAWEVHPTISPEPAERIFDKKISSAFKETTLREYLDSKGIKTIILVGMQTDYCIDTNCKVAFEFGYDLIIPEDTTTTFDNELCSAELLIKHYEQKRWNNKFAKVIPVDEVIEWIVN